jgi:hypothetical protein
MIEFNTDGSIKLPSHLLKNKLENENKMKHTRCMTIQKEVISTNAPKKCVLHITLSEAVTENVVERAFSFFERDAETPTKLIKRNEKEYDIEIGTSYKRCSECFELISRFKAYLEDNVIIDKGTCTFESKFFY